MQLDSSGVLELGRLCHPLAQGSSCAAMRARCA